MFDIRAFSAPISRGTPTWVPDKQAKKDLIKILGKEEVEKTLRAAMRMAWNKQILVRSGRTLWAIQHRANNLFFSRKSCKYGPLRITKGVIKL